MTLYQEVVQGIDGHWHDIGKVCRCGVDFTGADLMLVVPVEPDLARQLTDRIVESTRRAQALTLAANPERGRAEHITELMLTHIHAEIWGIVSDTLGIGGDDETG